MREARHKPAWDGIVLVGRDRAGASCDKVPCHVEGATLMEREVGPYNRFFGTWVRPAGYHRRSMAGVAQLDGEFPGHGNPVYSCWC